MLSHVYCILQSVTAVTRCGLGMADRISNLNPGLGLNSVSFVIYPKNGQNDVVRYKDTARIEIFSRRNGLVPLQSDALSRRHLGSKKLISSHPVMA